MGKRTKYVTDDYIEKVDHYLYNNLPLKKLMQEDSKYISKFNKDVIEGLLNKGEKYVQLEGNGDHVVLTSFGRLINTHKINQYGVRCSPHKFHAYVGKEKIDIEQIFEQQGWDYDFETLKSYYSKYKWKLVDYGRMYYYNDRG